VEIEESSLAAPRFLLPGRHDDDQKRVVHSGVVEVEVEPVNIGII
jgi:hypothetical protein